MTTGASPALEASLKVYKIKGNVTLNASGRWTPLQRRATVGGNDMLRIPSGSMVEILNTDTRRVYSSTVPGDMTVDALIAAAMEDAANITRATNRRITDTFGQKGQKTSRFNSVGLSRHDTDAGTSALTAFDPSVPYLRQLMELPDTTEYDGYSDIILIRRDIDGSYGSFNFAVFNTLDTPLFINIIDQHDKGDINFYFDENRIVTARGETIIGEYRYILPEKTAGYIVIASDKPFSAADIRSLLEGNTPASTGNFFYSLLRI